jgi:hypothetical protein
MGQRNGLVRWQLQTQRWQLLPEPAECCVVPSRVALTTAERRFAVLIATCCIRVAAEKHRGTHPSSLPPCCLGIYYKNNLRHCAPSCQACWRMFFVPCMLFCCFAWRALWHLAALHNPGMGEMHLSHSGTATALHSQCCQPLLRATALVHEHMC